VYTLSELLVDDIAICVNYVTDEYCKRTGKATGDVDIISASIELADNRVKVTDSSGKVVGFICWDYDRKVVRLISYFVAEGYRRSEVLYLISKQIEGVVKDCNKVVYKELYPNMVLPRVAKPGGTVDKDKYLARLKLLESKWSN